MPSLDTPPDSSSEDESVYGSEYSDANEGFSYEHLVVALVFLRCLRTRLSSFELRSEYDAAGKFDDVVVTWGPAGCEGKLEAYSLFVQLKHKISRDFLKLKESHFFSSTDKAKGFNIEKYYKSFKIAKSRLSGRQYALVLSTNAQLDDSALGFFRKRELSSSFNPETSVVWEQETNSSWEEELPSPVFGSELLRTGGDVYQLNLDNSRVMEKVENDHEFTKHFFLFCGQKDVKTIHNDIRIELSSLLGLSDNYETLSVCQKLRKGVKEWKVEKRCKVPESLTSNWTQWQEIVRQHVLMKITDCNRLTTRLKFHHVGSVREHLESANPAYVRPVSFEAMALTVTKVHQAIHPEPHVLVNIETFMESQERVLRCWGPFCRWLVLIDDTAEESGLSSSLLDKTRWQLEGGRRLIVVSMRDERSFQDSFWCGDVSDESWDDLLLTKIRLNGGKQKCKLRDLVSSKAELQSVVKRRPACLVALSRNSGYVKLGQPLDPLPANHVPRQLVTRRYVEDRFFSSLGVRDVCVMDNGTYLRLTVNLSHLVKHYKQCTLEELEKHLGLHSSGPILAKAEKFDTVALERICQKYKGLYLYTVNHTKCGWDVQSFGAGCGRIHHCVREQSVQLLEALHVSDNTVIVEGSPGVGKSTALLHLAREMQQKNPSTWIVQINLRECYEQLRKGMSGEEVREVMLRTAVPSEGISAGLESALLEHCLQKHKDVVCLVDSFNDVCPDYAEECIEALSLLSPRRGKLVVTTRPGVARLLEDRLGSLAHVLPAFSDGQLQKYFDGFRPRVPRVEIGTLKKPLKDLLRMPLFAEMYKDLIGVGTLSYDTVTLCEAFLQYKFRKLNSEQNLSDLEQINDEKIIWKSQEDKLKRLAGSLLARNEEIFQQLKRPSVDDIFVKSGIVHQGTGEMPLFGHSTFGEYFLAKWCLLDAGQKACAKVYSSAQTGRSLDFFLEVFDRLASRGCPMLSALMEGDERRVRALLKTGAGVEERDAWGRSALHLAAARGTEAALLQALCEGMPAVLEERDGLVRWTPLQYAASRGHWGAVEALLGAGACLSQLGNIQDAVCLLLSKNSLRVNSLVQNLLVNIAEEYGHSTVLNMLWKMYTKVVNDEVSDDSRRTELHIAIQKANEEDIRKLIRLRRDLDVPDKNGETPLHYAVRAKASDVVTLLILAGVRLDARDKDGRTPLHYAALLSSIKCVQLLASAGADVAARDQRGATALHCAAGEGAACVVEVLAAAGADVEARDSRGMSALHCAAREGSAKCVQLLLREGASVHARDSSGATALHHAAGAGDADTVKVLTEAGARAHLRDDDGMTALHYAAERGRAKCARLLVMTGATVNARDNSGATPLHRAVRASAADVAKLLVGAGADVHERDTRGKTPLHYAASRDCASLLVGAGADVNVRDKSGATPLHYAAKESATGVVELLLESGAHVHYRNSAGITALHYAASGGDVKCTRLLIRDIVSTNEPDKDGATPLHYAARAKNAECASLLVRAGADVRFRDSAGLTALHYAARAGNWECISFLVGAGLEVNDRDRKGTTPLHYAAMSCYTIPTEMEKLLRDATECIGRLLSSGAHPDTRDEQGKTALYCAVSAGNVAGAGLLIDAGADVLAADRCGETALHCAVRSGKSMCFTLLLRSVATNSASCRGAGMEDREKASL